MAQRTTYTCDGCGVVKEPGVEMRDWFRIDMTIYCIHGPSEFGFDMCHDCSPRFTEMLKTIFPLKFTREESEARH